jgi:hypothetical protein
MVGYEDGAPAPLHALFQQRVDGDDALLRLARLRFEQFGLAAEVYGGSAGELDHTLALCRATSAGRSCTCPGISTCFVRLTAPQ